MSLECICAECTTVVAHYSGVNNETKEKLNIPLEEEDTSNLLVVGVPTGNMGCTFVDDDWKVDHPQIFICRNCLRTKMPNVFKTLTEQEEKADDEIPTIEKRRAQV